MPPLKRGGIYSKIETMRKVLYLIFIVISSIKGYSCQPPYAWYGAINFQQDTINPLRFYFVCKIAVPNPCTENDSISINWSCHDGSNLKLPLRDTIPFIGNYVFAGNISVYSGWHTFDSIPSDSIVNVTCLIKQRAFAIDDDTNAMVIRATLNFAYLAHHTGIRSAQFNSPLIVAGYRREVLYFDPQIQHEASDSLWVTLTPPLADCDSATNIPFPDQFYPTSNDVLSVYNPTGFLIWDTPPYNLAFNFAYLVKAYRDNLFTYSLTAEGIIFSVDRLTDIDAINNYGQFKCYPSPSSGNFTIDMTDFDKGLRDIKIFNQLGQSVYQLTSTIDKVPISEILASGLYTVSVTTPTHTAITRIVIQ